MWITIAVIAVLIFALSQTKFEVRHDIIIAAPAQQVWEAVIDFKNYKNWNSQLLYLGGTVAKNEVIHLKLSVEGATPYEFKPTISHWQDGKTFAWIAVTGMPRLFDGEHFFELIPNENGTTTLINREEYRGVLSLVMKQLPAMKLAPKGFEKMNIELKRYVENVMMSAS